jgi:membrane protein YdbS with pleckstrin-like domain
VAYPEKVLADDEQVVEHLHPHWITLVPATLWFILICAAAGVGIAFAPDSGTAHTVVLIAIIVVDVFTTHRVLIRRGLLKQTGRDIALQRISDVGFTQSLLDRMVGAGTLAIESASEHGQETLTNVPNSDQQQQLLNRLIEQDGDRRARGAYSGGYPQQQGGYPQQQGGYPQQGGGPAPQQGQYPTQEYPPQR